MWFAVGILAYLILQAFVLLIIRGAKRAKIEEEEFKNRIRRFRDIPSAPLLRSGLPKEKTQNAGTLRNTGTGQ